MSRVERETMLSALIDAGVIIPDIVIMVKDTIEEAEKFISGQREADKLIENL